MGAGDEMSLMEIERTAVLVGCYSLEIKTVVEERGVATAARFRPAKIINGAGLLGMKYGGAVVFVHKYFRT